MASWKITFPLTASQTKAIARLEKEKEEAEKHHAQVVTDITLGTLMAALCVRTHMGSFDSPISFHACVWCGIGGLLSGAHRRRFKAQAHKSCRVSEQVAPPTMFLKNKGLRDEQIPDQVSKLLLISWMDLSCGGLLKRTC